MTAFVWVEEEVGLRENEIDEESATGGWEEFLRLKVSARLSEEENNYLERIFNLG